MLTTRLAVKPHRLWWETDNAASVRYSAPVAFYPIALPLLSDQSCVLMTKIPNATIYGLGSKIAGVQILYSQVLMTIDGDDNNR
ncbi:hypothetical protein AKJ16_DCAP11194 [Drosera capensis]